jgi:hypothetical protein
MKPDILVPLKGLSALVVTCALLVGGTVGGHASPVTPFVVTIEQVGSNVDATGSGEIDLTGLSLQGSGGPASAAINPGFSGSQFIIGKTNSFDIYGPFTGPNFGFGTSTPATISKGNLVGFALNVGQLYVPVGYVSNSPLIDSATYNNATFSSLMIIPGRYTYTWGSGAGQRVTLNIGQTPLPAALPLFATGLGVLGLLGWRRKQKAAIT